MKKYIAVLCSVCLLLSMCSLFAFATPTPPDIAIKEGTASSSEGWTFDGTTLTLGGGTFGTVFLTDNMSTDKPLSLNIVTTAPTTVSGIDHNGGWNITYTFTGTAALTVEGMIHSGYNNDAIVIDGTTVNTEDLAIGGSGFMGSYFTMKNGAVCNTASFGIENVTLQDTCELHVDATKHPFMTDTAIHLTPSSVYNVAETASITAKATEAAVTSENNADIAQILSMPAGTKMATYEAYGDGNLTLVDDTNAPLKEVKLFAAAVKPVQKEESKGVQAVYSDVSTKDTVYSVDVAWGAMEFTYTKTGENVWNPDTHQYTESDAGTWSANGNTITVTNHSNVALNANLSESLEKGLSGHFDNVQLSLPSAEGTTPAKAPQQVATFTMDSGKTDATDFAKIGTVTVTFTPAVYA